MTLRKRWIDHGREPQCAPDPAYPNGKPIDLSRGATETCSIELEHPTKRCGHWEVTCGECHFRLALTTAGRPDDPSSVKIACHFPYELAGKVRA